MCIERNMKVLGIVEGLTNNAIGTSNETNVKNAIGNILFENDFIDAFTVTICKF